METSGACPRQIDCPWRPSDLEQRQGRIERQGNMFPEVEVYRYVTEQTFDVYLYQLVESKQQKSACPRQKNINFIKVL